MTRKKIEKKSPAILLCEAITKKPGSVWCRCGIPNLIILAPGQLFTKKMMPYVKPSSFFPGPQIYIELQMGRCLS